MLPVINPKGERSFDLVLGNLYFRCFFTILKTLKATINSISIFDKQSDRYFEVKTFIEKIFRYHYRAEISVFMPELMAIINNQNKVVSAVGVRFAKDEKLFLEQYLQQKIEDEISNKIGVKIERKSIVEIGSLASSRQGSAKFLYVALASYLDMMGYQYVAMTGTKYLKDYFTSKGLNPIVLADAKYEMLENKNTNWGTYYENDPKVMILDIKKSHRILGGKFGIFTRQSLAVLYPHLKYV